MIPWTELQKLVLLKLSPLLSNRRRLIVAGSAGLLLLASGAGLLAFLGRPRAEVPVPQENPRRLFEQCMKMEEYWARRQNTKQAIRWLGYAIDATSIPEDRALAGLKMGQMLLSLAGDDRNQARAALQYLSAAASLERDPSRRMEAYRGIMKACSIVGDKKTATEVARNAVTMAVDADEKAQLYLLLIDESLAYGSPAEVQALLKESMPFLSAFPWNEQYQFRVAESTERVLSSREQFDRYASQYPEQNPADLRAAMTEKITEQYRKLAEAGHKTVKEECLYRIARVEFQEKRYTEARQTLKEFIDLGPITRLPEALMILIHLAQMQGDDATADLVIARFMQRQRLEGPILEEVFGVLDEMERRGHGRQALAMLGRSCMTASSDSNLARILHKAAKLSMKLGNNDEAALYCDRLIDLKIDSPLRGEAMLMRADICLEKKDLPGARASLLQFLSVFRGDALAGDALIRLFNVEVLQGAPTTDILLVGTAATQAAPRDPRAIRIRMHMAQLLEKNDLLALAESEYSQVAVLNNLSTMASSTGVLAAAVGEATLGKARCLLKMGEPVRADRLLREICRTFAPGPVRSEAAYLWATLAISTGQRAEGLRRLDLIRPEDATPDITARAQVERVMSDIASGNKPAETMDVVLSSLATISTEENTVLIRRAYTSYFDWLAGTKDLSGIQDFLEGTAHGPHAKELPLTLWALRLAQAVLVRQGVGGFAACMAKNVELLGEAAPASETDTQLLDSARQVEKARSAVARFL